MMHRSPLVGLVLALAACSERSPTGLTPIPLPRSDTIEARALWVSRFEYSSLTDIVTIMSDAKRANFNIVYLQVRGVADALYSSDLEPCSIRLCGKLGGTPTWDPLATAVGEAHRRGIQLHAWINAFTGWTPTSATTCAALADSDPGNPRHVLLQHPDWRVVDNTGAAHPCPNSEESVWMSPGIPGVRTQLARVAADIARRYDVDGVHLDFIRYPGLKWSHDAVSLGAFGLDPATNPGAWSQFRRDQVSAAVRETRDSLLAANGSPVLSAAVWGIYRDRWSWNSSDGFAQYFQDPRAWAGAGTLDVAVPMAYWTIKSGYCAFADWACLLDDHIAGYAASGRHMYIGMLATYGTSEMLAQIARGRDKGVRGFSVFSYGSAKSTGLFDALASSAFRLPATVPEMSWRSAAATEPE
jgi:uncharacterized lipoprotein YddW (UPF0748 family)